MSELYTILIKQKKLLRELMRLKVDEAQNVNKEKDLNRISTEVKFLREMYYDVKFDIIDIEKSEFFLNPTKISAWN